MEDCYARLHRSVAGPAQDHNVIYIDRSPLEGAASYAADEAAMWEDPELRRHGRGFAFGIGEADG
jgi:hypothetical protein